jgi:VanZ family protein
MDPRFAWPDLPASSALQRDRLRAVFLFIRARGYRGILQSDMDILIHKLMALAAWGLLVFIAYATVAPIQNRPTLPTSISFEHLAAFATLGALFSFAYPRQVVLVCLVVFGSAILLELLQLLTPDRHGRVADAIEKMAGGVVGIAVGRAMLYFNQANDWFQN